MDHEVWGQVDGQTITFPLVVPRFNLATLMFSVPATVATSLLPGQAFEVVETGPGVAQLVIAACDYRENPWGDYDELNLGFLVRPRGGGDATTGSFIYRMPVNQDFTCKVGNQVMGFPKTVEAIVVDYADNDVSFALTGDGQLALRLVVPRAREAGNVTRIASISYSYLDGAPHATALEVDMDFDAHVDVARVLVELGTGAVADEFRRLGLPATPDLVTWGEGLSGVFHRTRPIEI